MIINDDYIEHFGVKGMKWGIRNKLGAYKDANRAHKNAIKKAYININKNASLGEKLLYSDKTRKRAAKYVVDNNMSVDEATRKAKDDVRRKAQISAAVGFVATFSTVAMDYALSKK